MARGRRSHRPVWDGTRIARDMMRAGLDQQALAKKAKVTGATVSRLINRTGVVSPKLAGKVAKALGHPLDRYLDGLDVEVPPANVQISA